MAVLRRIRLLIYRWGGRPKPGSIFYSPSMAWLYSWKDAQKKSDL